MFLRMLNTKPEPDNILYEEENIFLIVTKEI